MTTTEVALGRQCHRDTIRFQYDSHTEIERTTIIIEGKAEGDLICQVLDQAVG